LLSTLLGSKRAPAAVALFLAQGAFGLPVFTHGGCGLAYFFGPRGGYLIGYLVAAYTVGKVVELLGKRTLSTAFTAMLAGNAVLFLCGATWLSTFIGVEKAILLGVVPFLLGDLLKIACSLKILHWMGWAR
jgi:biotin transport system substrate-specific component